MQIAEGRNAGRVLIYLEAGAAGQPVPDYAVHLLGDLLHAGEALGLLSLQVRAPTEQVRGCIEMHHAAQPSAPS